MKSFPAKITIRLSFTQEIFVGHGIFDFVVNKIRSMNYEKFLMVIDENFYKLIGHDFQKRFGSDVSVVLVKPVLKGKDFTRCASVIKKMIEFHMNRRCCLVAFGGGYVGDLVGFVAAIYMRGIDFIQIPSTIMGMADAIIGKVAINFHGIKNLLGSFSSPRYTFCDTVFLSTLAESETVLGLVEIWKHALVTNNQRISRKIVSCLIYPKNCALYTELIIFSLKTKKIFVEKDPYDTRGLQKALSLGHTFANYLEHHLALRHGQAVFYGILFEMLLSLQLRTMGARRFMLLEPILYAFEQRIGLLKHIQEHLSVDEVVKGLRFDKINQGDFFTFVLLTNTGFKVKRSITASEVREALQTFISFIYMQSGV